MEIVSIHTQASIHRTPSWCSTQHPACANVHTMTTAHDSHPTDCRWSLDTGQNGRTRDHHEAWTTALAATVQTWREGHTGPCACHR